VFELEDDAQPPAADRFGDGEPAAVEAVYPWVAGFATAMEHFPALMQLDAATLTEPLALLYRHLDPEDLKTPMTCSRRSSRWSRRRIWPKRSRAWCAPRCCWPMSAARSRHGDRRRRSASCEASRGCFLTG
jgi:hypothetical protein